MFHTTEVEYSEKPANPTLDLFVILLRFLLQFSQKTNQFNKN